MLICFDNTNLIYSYFSSSFHILLLLNTLYYSKCLSNLFKCDRCNFFSFCNDISSSSNYIRKLLTFFKAASLSFTCFMFNFMLFLVLAKSVLFEQCGFTYFSLILSFTCWWACDGCRFSGVCQIDNYLDFLIIFCFYLSPR